MEGSPPRVLQPSNSASVLFRNHFTDQRQTGLTKRVDGERRVPRVYLPHFGFRRHRTRSCALQRHTMRRLVFRSSSRCFAPFFLFLEPDLFQTKNVLESPRFTL